VRRARIQAIYQEDEGKALRTSHENPEVVQIYEEFLGKPLGERSHHLLHTHYEARGRV
jgi:iron only hydrogenase large subunit-like protein